MRWGAKKQNKKRLRDCINFWLALPGLKNPTGDPLTLQLNSTFPKSRKSNQLPVKVAEHLGPQGSPPPPWAEHLRPQGSPPPPWAEHLRPQGSPPPLGRSTYVPRALPPLNKININKQ